MAPERRLNKMTDPLKKIAAQHSDDPVLANFEAAVRDGLAKSTTKAETPPERTVDEEIAAGDVARFDSIEELIEDLRDSNLPDAVVSFMAGQNKTIEILGAVFRAIVSLGGNLSDEALITRTGPNDAAQRGLMYVEARRIAKDVLDQIYANGQGNHPISDQSAEVANP